MILLGSVLVTLGIGLSVALIVYDIRRRRIARTEPQAAPRRLGPEPHIIATFITGIGAWLAWDWLIALAAMLPQGVVAAALIIDMMEQNR